MNAGRNPRDFLMLTPHENQLRFRRADFDKIPANALGVYGVWFRNRCIYIGEAYAQPIAIRLTQHWRGSHNPDLADWVKAKGPELRISYIVALDECVIHNLERSCIRRLQPMANRTGLSG